MKEKKSRHCKLIAALETNHNGDLALAKRMIDEAISSGCDAVKVPRKHVATFFTPEVQKQPIYDYPEIGETVGQVHSALEFKFDELKELRDYCRGRIEFIAAPYDEISLKEMDALDPEGYQIDSPVLVHVPLLEKLEKKKKPIFAVLGLYTDTEIAHMVQILGKADLTLIHCIQASPLPLEDTALGNITHLKNRFNCPVGYYGLEEGSDAALVAFALGASVIEKPFTLDRHLRGPYHANSAGREEWHSLVRSIRAIEKSLHPVESRNLNEIELENLSNQRICLVAAKDLPKGTVLEKNNVSIKAATKGISPRLLPKVIGKKVLYDLSEGSPITFGMVSN